MSAAVRRLSLVALALLAQAGCSRDDLCVDVPTTCLTVKVDGTLLEGASLAGLVVDTYYQSANMTRSHRAVIAPKEQADGGASLPAEFPVVFDSEYDKLQEYESAIVVSALDGAGTTIGIGSTQFGVYQNPAVAPGAHKFIGISLVPPTPAQDCFNTPTPKCGYSSCPLCTSGSSCSYDYDCVSGSCDSYTCR